MTKKDDSIPMFDGPTKKWMEKHPGAETTVMRCDACGLYYKPILGHACKKRQSPDKEWLE